MKQTTFKRVFQKYMVRERREVKIVITGDANTVKGIVTKIGRHLNNLGWEEIVKERMSWFTEVSNESKSKRMKKKKKYLGSLLR